jgi:hypothetical protein
MSPFYKQVQSTFWYHHVHMPVTFEATDLSFCEIRGELTLHYVICHCSSINKPMMWECQ